MKFLSLFCKQFEQSFSVFIAKNRNNFQKQIFINAKPNNELIFTVDHQKQTWKNVTVANAAPGVEKINEINIQVVSTTHVLFCILAQRCLQWSKCVAKIVTNDVSPSFGDKYTDGFPSEIYIHLVEIPVTDYQSLLTSHESSFNISWEQLFV